MRRGLRYRRVYVPESREAWYRSSFGRVDLYEPRSSHPDAEEIHRTSKSRVFRLRERALYLKEEPYPFPAILRGLGSTPRVVREFSNLVLLRSMGCPAVEPLAYGVAGMRPLYSRSFLITAEFSGAQTLKEWSSNPSGLAPDRGAVRTAMLGLARTLGRLHRTGYFVRTLYAKNVLVRETAAGAAEIALCDVPRLWRATRLLRWPSASRMSWFQFIFASFDLACLEKWACRVYSVRDRAEFLKVYLEELQVGPPRKRWIQRIRNKTGYLLHQTRWGELNMKFRTFLIQHRLNKYWPF